MFRKKRKKKSPDGVSFFFSFWKLVFHQTAANHLSLSPWVTERRTRKKGAAGARERRTP